MKRSKFMRLASVLLVVTLLSTCAVSGTFAKYVTQASGNDSARVARWGVQLSITGKNFANQYATHDTTGTDQPYSVMANATDMVVAPGTSSSDVEGDVTFAITGAPEVVTKVQITLGNVNDIKLPAANGYTDYTTVTGYDTDGNPTYGTFNLDADYYPVKWTLKENGTVVSYGDTSLENVKLADIQAFLNTYNATPAMCTYRANQPLNSTFTLTWAWDFDANGAGTNDKADTYLGNVIAGITTDASAVTTVSYNLTVTATQVN